MDFVNECLSEVNFIYFYMSKDDGNGKRVDRNCWDDIEGLKRGFK